MRTPGLPLLDQTLAKLGATTVAMRGADARLAALAGSLDAEETTTSAFRASHAAAAGLTHLQLWDAHADALIFAVNPIWNSWSEADRQLVRDAARDAARRRLRCARRQDDDGALGEAARQGATITRLTDAGKQAFRDATRPVYDQWAALIGAESGATGAEAAVAAPHCHAASARQRNEAAEAHRGLAALGFARRHDQHAVVVWSARSRYRHPLHRRFPARWIVCSPCTGS